MSKQRRKAASEDVGVEPFSGERLSPWTAFRGSFADCDFWSKGLLLTFGPLPKVRLAPIAADILFVEERDKKIAADSGKQLLKLLYFQYHWQCKLRLYRNATFNGRIDFWEIDQAVFEDAVYF